MKRQYILFGILGIFALSILTPSVRGYEETIYLTNEVSINIDLEKGNYVRWEFKTFDEPFEVWFFIFYLYSNTPITTLSTNEYSDSGSFEVSYNPSFACEFRIQRRGGSLGYITVKINVNPFGIGGYNLLFLLGIMGISSILLRKIIKKERINQRKKINFLNFSF